MLEDEVEEEEEEEEEDSSEESADEPLDEEAERRDFVEEALDDLTLRDFVEEAGDGEAGPSDDAALAPWASSSLGLCRLAGLCSWTGVCVLQSQGRLLIIQAEPFLGRAFVFFMCGSAHWLAKMELEAFRGLWRPTSTTKA